MKEKNHVVLINPSDMGNVGTIIRTMIGFGIKNLVLIKPAVDIFDPKVIRSSLGAIFQINFEYFNSLEDYRNLFSNNSYIFSLKGKSINLVKFQQPFALVFGNEGGGVPADVLTRYCCNYSSQQRYR